MPTWNYVAVHAHGAVSTFADPDDLRSHITRLTDAMEGDAPTPWSVSDAPEDYISRLANGIVGVRLHVERLQGIRKLSQNRSDADRGGVLKAFVQSDDASARKLAAEIQRDMAQ